MPRSSAAPRALCLVSLPLGHESLDEHLLKQDELEVRKEDMDAPDKIE